MNACYRLSLVVILVVLVLAGCSQPEESAPTPTLLVSPAVPEPTTAPVTISPTSVPPTPVPPAAMFRGDAAHSGVYQAEGGAVEWLFEAGSELFSSPAIVEGVLYAAGTDGIFYAIDARTGKPVWTFKVNLPIGSSPTVSQGTVCFGTGLDFSGEAKQGDVYCLDTQTGRERWHFKTGGTVVSSPAIAGTTVLAASMDGNLYALDLGSGEEQWRFESGAPLIASPVIAGGVVYIGSADGVLFGIDLATGKKVGTFAASGGIACSAAIAGGTAYVGDGNGKFYAVDLKSGRARWQFQAQGTVDSSPAVAGGLVYFGSYDQNVYALDIQTGEQVWRFNAYAPVLSSPAVAGDTVYVGSFNGRVYALDARTGEERWRFQAEGDIQASPSVAGDTLYVPSFDKRLYALDRSGPKVALLPPTPTSRPPQATPTPLPDVAAPVATGTDGLPWWNDRVFYEAFVRSFKDSDGDGNGDLKGLIEKLDYLNDGDPATSTDLGVTGLWLMPIMQSPSYHGYDVMDYKTIEQDYGTNADFQTLVAEAHKRGIAVIVDLVMNHTSSEHPWFVDAQTPGSEHDSWYIWRTDPPDYLSPWGTPVWYWLGNRYFYGLFWEGMPDLNYENGAVTLAMRDIINFWLTDMGADGFRLDAVRHLIEDGEVQANTPATHTWLEDFHRYVRSVAPQAFTVGEAWDKTPEMVKYVGDEVDIVFEFDLAQAILDAVWRGDNGGLVQAQKLVLDSYPKGQYGIFLTNHDQNRVMNQLRNNVPSAHVAATLLLTNPGVPFIYYGEEIGMRGAKPDERIRTPMQWDETATAGFTTGTPWETLNGDSPEVNVAAQAADSGSLLNHYRALVALREAHPALRGGDMVPVESSSRQVYSYLRQDSAETLLVVVNLSGRPVSDYRLSLAEGPLTGSPRATPLLGEGQPAAPAVNPAGGFDAYQPLPTLPPYGSLVIELK
jgi:glycosidase/outer membrane protein assembly factor BamB